MAVNGESIYGTSANPFTNLTWGTCTKKPGKHGDTNLYLHVFDWPADGKLLVPGLANQVLSASLLAGATEVPCETTPDGKVLTLPASAPDPISSTIKLVIKGHPEVVVAPPLPKPDGLITLSPLDAQLHGNTIKVESKKHSPANIGFWTDPADTVSWNFMPERGGKFAISLEVASAGSGSVIQLTGLGNFACTVPKTGNHQTYQTVKVGVVTLTKGKKATLRLQPVAKGWKPINIRMLELTPQS